MDSYETNYIYAHLSNINFLTFIIISKTNSLSSILKDLHRTFLLCDLWFIYVTYGII